MSTVSALWLYKETLKPHDTVAWGCFRNPFRPFTHRTFVTGIYKHQNKEMDYVSMKPASKLQTPLQKQQLLRGPWHRSSSASINLFMLAKKKNIVRFTIILTVWLHKHSQIKVTTNQINGPSLLYAYHYIISKLVAPASYFWRPKQTDPLQILPPLRFAQETDFVGAILSLPRELQGSEAFDVLSIHSISKKGEVRSKRFKESKSEGFLGSQNFKIRFHSNVAKEKWHLLLLIIC